MTDTPSPYGFCPICGGLGRSRERRLNGDDRCENGHTYPSSKSVASTLTPVPSEAEQLHRLRIERDHFREAWAAAQVTNIDHKRTITKGKRKGEEEVTHASHSINGREYDWFDIVDLREWVGAKHE